VLEASFFVPLVDPAALTDVTLSFFSSLIIVSLKLKE